VGAPRGRGEKNIFGRRAPKYKSRGRISSKNKRKGLRASIPYFPPTRKGKRGKEEKKAYIASPKMEPFILGGGRSCKGRGVIVLAFWRRALNLGRRLPPLGGG